MGRGGHRVPSSTPPFSLTGQALCPGGCCARAGASQLSCSSCGPALPAWVACGCLWLSGGNEGVRRCHSPRWLQGASCPACLPWGLGDRATSFPGPSFSFLSPRLSPGGWMRLYPLCGEGQERRTILTRACHKLTLGLLGPSSVPSFSQFLHPVPGLSQLSSCASSPSTWKVFSH